MCEMPIKIYNNELNHTEFIPFTQEYIDKINTDLKDYLKIILFNYEDDVGYYEKLYINECITSWRRCFGDKIVFISVLFTPEIRALSKWTSLEWGGNKKYPTDSLRLYFVSLFDNALYLDTDVFLRKEFKIWNKDSLCLSCCTGTFLYCPEKGNAEIRDFFNFYENMAQSFMDEIKNNPEKWNVSIGNVPWWKDDYGDISMYLRWRKNCIENNKFYITSHEKDFNVAHFSDTWPWIRDKQEFCIVTEKMDKEKWDKCIAMSNKKRILHYPPEAKWAFIYYVIDKKLQPKIVDKIEDVDTENFVVFY